MNKIQKILGCTLKTRIYISGPITGLSIDEAYNNFERAERRLNALGFEAVNVMKLVPYKDGKSWWEYLSEDIAILGTCKAIYMLRGWGSSDGAKIEHHCADLKKYPVAHESMSDEKIIEKLK